MPSSTSSSSESHSRFLPGPRPRRIAHRGFALDGAENTLRAFRDALGEGADMLETDTRSTADGTALAFHDETLQRVAGLDLPVAELRDKDVDTVRVAGDEPLARLDDVLDAFRHVPVNIDVKDEAAIAPAARAIARTRAARRICVTSFDDWVARSAVEAVRATSGVVPMRSPSRGRITAVLAAQAVEVPDAVMRRLLHPYGALQIPPTHRGVRILTPRLVAAAHRAGCEVHVWTIDDPAHMSDLLKMGVDGIVTNRVDLLSDLLESSEGNNPRPLSAAP